MDGGQNVLTTGKKKERGGGYAHCLTVSSVKQLGLGQRP
jgi:hypothetical protein